MKKGNMNRFNETAEWVEELTIYGKVSLIIVYVVTWTVIFCLAS